jgi:hypothetical protein
MRWTKGKPGWVRKFYHYTDHKHTYHMCAADVFDTRQAWTPMQQAATWAAFIQDTTKAERCSFT